VKKPESKVQRQIRRALEQEFGGVWFKVHGGMYQQPGILDLIGCLYGYHFEIEVKTEEDRRDENPLQIKRCKDIKANGGCSFFTTNPEAAVRKVRKFLENKAIQTAASGRPLSATERQLCIIYGSRDWKDDYVSKSRRKTTPEEFRHSHLNILPKKCDG